MTVVEQGHLGGYVVGGDDATWYPDMWSWLVAWKNLKSVLDIGCGEGYSLKYFRDTLGCWVYGIDGVPQDDPDIWTHDFTEGRDNGLSWPADLQFDLGWCCETVEHIEEDYLPNLLEAFTHCKVVLLTHAEPGQQGYHHVNCQTADYWRGAMAAIGFTLDQELTDFSRLRAAANTNPYNHYRRSGLAFTCTPS